jgi:hypothetical protein
VAGLNGVTAVRGWQAATAGAIESIQIRAIIERISRLLAAVLWKDARVMAAIPIAMAPHTDCV